MGHTAHPRSSQTHAESKGRQNSLSSVAECLSSQCQVVLCRKRVCVCVRQLLRCVFVWWVGVSGWMCLVERNMAVKVNRVLRGAKQRKKNVISVLLLGDVANNRCYNPDPALCFGIMDRRD